MKILKDIFMILKVGRVFLRQRSRHIKSKRLMKFNYIKIQNICAPKCTLGKVQTNQIEENICITEQGLTFRIHNELL